MISLMSWIDCFESECSVFEDDFVDQVYWDGRLRGLNEVHELMCDPHKAFKRQAMFM